MRQFHELSPLVSLGVALSSRRYWWLASGSSVHRYRSLHTLGWSSSPAVQEREEDGSKGGGVTKTSPLCDALMTLEQRESWGAGAATVSRLWLKPPANCARTARFTARHGVWDGRDGNVCVWRRGIQFDACQILHVDARWIVALQ